MNNWVPEEEFFERLADAAQLSDEPIRAPAKLKSRIYSALMLCEAAAGALASLTECKAAGHGLCVFEELVRITPLGEGAKSLNFCRICHARLLAEGVEKAPIYWPNCPYVKFHAD